MKANRNNEQKDSWRLDEEVRRRRLREDGERSLAINLSETIALSEFFSSFAGSAWNAQRASQS